MKKNLLVSLLLLSLVLSPLSLNAQIQRNPLPFTGSTQGSSSGSPTIPKLIQKGLEVLNLLVSFAIGLSLVVFLFSMVKYFTTESAEDKNGARRMMIYGIVALFVAVSVWGLVKFIQDATGITGQEQVRPPELPTY